MRACRLQVAGLVCLCGPKIYPCAHPQNRTACAGGVASLQGAQGASYHKGYKKAEQWPKNGQPNSFRLSPRDGNCACFVFFGRVPVCVFVCAVFLCMWFVWCANASANACASASASERKIWRLRQCGDEDTHMGCARHMQKKSRTQTHTHTRLHPAFTQQSPGMYAACTWDACEWWQVMKKVCVFF